jgi:exodeoxyribonuclease VII large subunit
LIRLGEILWGRMQRSMQRCIESRMQHADMLECRLIHPGKRINDRLAYLQRLHKRLAGSWSRDSESKNWRLRELDQRITTASPDISRLAERQRELGLRLRRAVAVHLETLIMNLQRRQADLANLNPKSVLGRGYSIAFTVDGEVLRNSDQIDVGDTIRVAFAKGWSKASVTEKGE